MDAEALDAVIAYRSPHKQVWDNTDIGSPWMNLMRNSINAQVFSFRHSEFLAVSATHGTAHLALYDQVIWDKYQLASIAGPDFRTNTLIVVKAAPSDAAAHEDPKSLFGAPGNTIPTLQHRGAVFMGCHNAIWELTDKLQEKGVNPDRLSHEAMAAELTNHLVEGVVLTPGIVGTIPELRACRLRLREMSRAMTILPTQHGSLASADDWRWQSCGAAHPAAAAADPVQWNGKAEASALQREDVFPPWQHGQQQRCD